VINIVILLQIMDRKKRVLT